MPLYPLKHAQLPVRCVPGGLVSPKASLHMVHLSTCSQSLEGEGRSWETQRVGKGFRAFSMCFTAFSLNAPKMLGALEEGQLLWHP